MYYIIKYAVTVLVLYDRWDQNVEQTNKVESSRTVYEDGWCIFLTTFLEGERVLMILKYTETCSRNNQKVSKAVFRIRGPVQTNNRE